MNSPIKMNVSHISKKRRRGKRKRKSTIFFDDIQNNNNDIPLNNPTNEEIRKLHSQKLSNVFEKYFFNRLCDLNLSLKREKERVNGLIKNLNNSLSLKEQISVSKNMGYLVSSSDKKNTYHVKTKKLNNQILLICNCGEKYNDFERKTCKHCGSVVIHKLDNFISEFLKKQSQKYQYNEVNKMLKKFTFEDKNKKEQCDENNEEDYLSKLMNNI